MKRLILPALVLALLLCACGSVSGRGAVDRPVLQTLTSPDSVSVQEPAAAPEPEEPDEPEESDAPAFVSVSGESEAPQESGGDAESESTSEAAYRARGTHAPTVNELHRIINEERENHGLSALVLREDLCETAQVRAYEAAENWSHTRPDGAEWDTVLKQAEIPYRAAGENLFAANILDAKAALQGWLDSAAHRENLLRDSFTATGLAIVDGGDGYYYYAQIFLTE